MIALITGITGQDGSYLSEHLLGLGYEVHGLVRDEASARSCPNLSAISPRLKLYPAGWSDPAVLGGLLGSIAPDEIYHLAAQTHVPQSYSDPVGTCDFNALGTLRLLEGIRHHRPAARFFHAASSQVFGLADHSPQTEETPFRPNNPYGASKAMAANLVRIYREVHGLFAVNGICFNHESPRRGSDFVTGKICRAAAAIHQGKRDPLPLGDLTARRDWGDAREFVLGFHLSLQNAVADDYVFATGRLHSVQDVLEASFGAVGLDWREWVRHDPSLLRPVEPPPACGDPARAKTRLGWVHRGILRDLIREMTLAQLA